MKSFLKTQLLVLFLTLIGVELLLHFFSGMALKRILAPPWERDAPVVEDQQMILRGNPLRPDADARGYRNLRRPEVAEIVTLGDSQTWGPSDDFRESWPALLSKGIGHPVYNMALPGYGPGHYLLQLDEALSLKPKLLIVAPYFGNDFYDSFAVFLRHRELSKGISPHLVEEALEREHRRPIQTDIEILSSFAENPLLANKTVSPIRRWLSDNSRIYGLLRAVRDRFDPPPVTPVLSPNLDVAAAALTSQKREYVSVFKGSDWKTILTSPYRNRVLDDTDPRIRAGFELSRYAVDQIAARCREAGVDLLIVLIPTKENVFFSRVPSPESHSELQALVENEERLKAEWINDLQRHGISYIDVLNPLRQAAVQPYPENVDGHPNHDGYAIIAREIATNITQSRHEFLQEQ
jgi:hypothetical protein